MVRGIRAWTPVISWQVLPSPAPAESVETLSPPTRLASLDVVSCTDCSSTGTPVLLCSASLPSSFRACAWPQRQAPGSCPRKVGREGPQSRMESSRGGGWEGALLPGLVLERKKGSRAASPAALLVCPGQEREGGGGGGGRVCWTVPCPPPAPGAQTKEAARIRKSEDGKFQGLPAPPAPERVWAERRQR